MVTALAYSFFETQIRQHIAQIVEADVGIAMARNNLFFCLLPPAHLQYRSPFLSFPEKLVNLFLSSPSSTGAGQNSSFPWVGTARCAVRTPQRGVPTIEEFCLAPFFN
jgi:hypothetical protein